MRALTLYRYKCKIYPILIHNPVTQNYCAPVNIFTSSILKTFIKPCKVHFLEFEWRLISTAEWGSGEFGKRIGWKPLVRGQPGLAPLRWYLYSPAVSWVCWVCL